jgi:hypothetical protein
VKAKIRAHRGSRTRDANEVSGHWAALEVDNGVLRRFPSAERMARHIARCHRFRRVSLKSVAMIR